MKTLKTNKTSEFFKNVIELISEKPRTTEEIYRYISTTEVSLGGNPNNIKPSEVLNDLITILGNKLENIEDTDAVRRGRLIPKIFCIKGTVEEALFKVDSFFEKEAGLKASKREKPTNSFTETGVNKTPNSYLSKKAAIRIKDILSLMKGRGDDTMTFSEIANRNQCIVSTQALDKWFENISNAGVVIKYEILKPTSGNYKDGCSLRISEPEASLKELLSKLPIFKKEDKVSVEKVEEPAVKPEEKVMPMEQKSEEAPRQHVIIPARRYAAVQAAKEAKDGKVSVIVNRSSNGGAKTLNNKLFYLVSLLVKAERVLDIDDVCKSFRDNKIDTEMVKAKFIDLVRAPFCKDYFEVTNNSNVGFKNKNLATSETNPFSKKHVVFARIGMSLDEVKAYGIEAEIVSPISEHDNIYKLFTDESQHCMSRLMRLYRTFRDTDTLIGCEKLKADLEFQIKIADSLWNGNNIIYQLERSLVNK